MSDAAPPLAIEPACDCPGCPACEAPCGTLEGEAVPDGFLRCAACGEDWEATAEELEQARAADAAWETKQIAYEAPAEADKRRRLVKEAAAEHGRRQLRLDL